MRNLGNYQAELYEKHKEREEKRSISRKAHLDFNEKKQIETSQDLAGSVAVG